MFKYNLNNINSAQQFAEVSKVYEEQREYIERKDAAIFQTLEESKKQNNLLAEQIGALKEQNNLLNEMYENAKKESEENKKQAKQSKFFGWISFAVGTTIAILGVILGIIF